MPVLADSMSIGELMLLACLALVLTPPKYDPAILLKEWLMKDRKK